MASRAGTAPGPASIDQLAAIREQARQLDGEVEFLAWELRPAALDDLGLVAALEQYFVEWSRHYGIEADFHADALRLDPELEISLYRIAQEALNNVVKHAQASRVEVLLEAVRARSCSSSRTTASGSSRRKRPDGSRPARHGGARLAGRRLARDRINRRAGATVFVRIPLDGEEGLTCRRSACCSPMITRRSAKP